ncbi:hypothetical protein [Symbiobacterium thermophilum]|uniref:Uncharacterized protein n=1 Tax=Symbiobacterium thermophilum TaxID=2734 RepID=A0A953IE47_SYMTR|nr:hypothetical protein [Symbiobacterium thermophilum]MBY6276700.1 hypothetical protein [Symbiobacterium thermophilum]
MCWHCSGHDWDWDWDWNCDCQCPCHCRGDRRRRFDRKRRCDLHDDWDGGWDGHDRGRCRRSRRRRCDHRDDDPKSDLCSRPVVVHGHGGAKRFLFI